MAYAHGKNLDFRLDNAAGALQNLSAYVDEASPSRDLDTADVTNGASAGARQHIVGLEGSTISCSGPWDAVLDAHMDALLVAFRAQTIESCTFNLYPTGNATGKIKLSGEAILSNYDVDLSVDDAIRWSAELQVTGVYTREIVP